MKKRILCVFILMVLMIFSYRTIAYPSRSVDVLNASYRSTGRTSSFSLQIQPEVSSFDPAWIVGTLFGKIKNPQLTENEYGNLYLSFHAIQIFLIGHYTGFGSGPAFIFKQDTNLSFQYGDYPGFKGWYWDHFIFGRYNGL